MQAEFLRAWWANAQGLLDPLDGASSEQVLESVGWARSVGGSNPYLGLFARSGLTREQVDCSIAELSIHELPSARGCTYVVPKKQFALALKVSQSFNKSGEIVVARKLGVTDQEIDRLCQLVLEVLNDGPKDPAALKSVLGGAVRNLGEEGKKKGMTTTLPTALGILQCAGEIRRRPTNGRLDQQRYVYVRWTDNPLSGFTLTAAEALTELARQYFFWIGPASLAHWQWFSGLSQRAAKAAIEPLELVSIEPGSELLILREYVQSFEAFEPPEFPSYRLTSGIDSILLLRRDVKSLLDPADFDRKTTGSKGIFDLGKVQDISSNAILDRGRLVGLWEYDVETQSIVWWSFVPPDESLRQQIKLTECYIQTQLGDARSFSLDSPESRKPIIAALRAAAK